jgi:DNA-binding PadR family transcriptional regulator
MASSSPLDLADLISSLMRGGPRRRAMFEAGQMRLVILKLLHERARHGYDIIKALEELSSGGYSPSAGTVYPTLSLLEELSQVEATPEGGRRVFRLTKQGQEELQRRHQEVSEIFERVGKEAHHVSAGSLGELREAFQQLAKAVFQGTWFSPSAKAVREVAQLLNRTTQEVEKLYQRRSTH